MIVLQIEHNMASNANSIPDIALIRQIDTRASLLYDRKVLIPSLNISDRDSTFTCSY